MYKNVQIKFYSDKLDKTDCLAFLDNIPEKYLNGLTYISFYTHRENQKVAGQYFSRTKGIKIYDGCNIKYLVHELAHHKTHMDGYSRDDAYYYDIEKHEYTHTKIFYNAESTIMIAIQDKMMEDVYEKDPILKKDVSIDVLPVKSDVLPMLKTDKSVNDDKIESIKILHNIKNPRPSIVTSIINFFKSLLSF